MAIKRYTKHSVLKYDIVKQYRYIVFSDGEILDSITLELVEIKKRSDGSETVKLATSNGTYKSYTLNRIVADHFLKRTKCDDIHERFIVHPIDWDKTNHNVNNLQWVNGLEIRILRDNKNKHQKTLDEVKKNIKKLLDNGYTVKEIKKIYPYIADTLIKIIKLS